MSYYILRQVMYRDEETGENIPRRTYHDSTFMGMMSFSGIHKAIEYRTKKEASAVLKGRKGLQVISREDAVQMELNKHHG